MPTKGQTLVIYAGALAILLLTVIYEVVSQVLPLDLWFTLCLIIFLTIDVVSEYPIKDNRIRMLNSIILYCGFAIFCVIAIYKFLILMGFTF